MERDSFVFYRSFYEALKCLDDSTALEYLKAILGYALDGEEPDIEGPAKAAFILVKPQIDANNRRFMNGCKGGRPKDNQTKTKTKPNDNQSKTKQKPNVNVNVNENVNVNDNENDNENVNEKIKEKVKKEKYGKNVTLTIDEYQKLVTDFGYDDTQEAIQFLDDYIADKGYKSKSNYSAIRRWVIDAVRDRRKKKPPTGSIDDFFRQRIGNE